MRSLQSGQVLPGKLDLLLITDELEVNVIFFGCRGQLTKTYLDIDNPALIYTDTPGGWAKYNDYASPSYNATLPPGVTNPQFESTKLPGSSVSLRFNGEFVLYSFNF